MQVELEPAFILSTKKFRETSILVDLFTKNYGRVSVIARGVRKTKSKLAGVMQPFMPILVSYYGKTNLYTLKSAEPAGLANFLFGKSLLSGLYLNEVSSKLLAELDPYPHIFDLYKNTLSTLKDPLMIETSLRYFELGLLEQIGYKLVLDKTFDTQHLISPNKKYQYILGLGLQECSSNITSSFFMGESLLALNNKNLKTNQQKLDAKNLMRSVINYYLDGKTLNVRNIYSSSLAMKTIDNKDTNPQKK